jgi:uncharacterized protein YjbJ (UPF0337 family)
MNQDRVKGAIDEVVGSAKQQFGKLTGNKGTQVKGTVQVIKGKAESAWGKTKDAVRNGRPGPVIVERRDDGEGSF